MFLTSSLLLCVGLTTALFVPVTHTASAALWDGLALAAPAVGDDAPTVLVGDRSVRGKTIKPFDNRWTGARGAVISETATLERRDGRKTIIRLQVWPLQPGIDLHTELVMDATTLETISLSQEVKGLPEGAGLGGKPILTRWEFDGAQYTRTVRVSGDPVITTGALDQPMFDGGGLGLIIAALPLKQDYSVRLPIAMPLGLTEELTMYWVIVKVVGSETVVGKRGKQVRAWVVNVDWADYDSGAITSKGGANESGGAYYVVARPPKGFPHVPRYVNDGGAIDLVVEE